MYPVSAAYKTAIQQNVRDVKITGTITLKDSTVINITDADIIQGSLYVTEQCVSGEDIEIGNVYAAEMGLVLKTDLANPYILDGAQIALSFGLLVKSSWEYVPLGYFYVADIKRQHGAVNLIAYDGMLLFDVLCGEPGAMTPRGCIVYACGLAGVTLGTSIAAIDALPNATAVITAPDPAKVTTCRDLLMWTCQLMGCFARMSRHGQLEIVPVTGRDSVRNINKGERYTTNVSDFVVKVTKVSMRDYAQGIDGMTLELEDNPLVAESSAEQIAAALGNILDQVTLAEYVPFNLSFAGDPSIECGDYITIRDAGILDKVIDTYYLSEAMPFEIGIDVVTSMVTHTTWRYRGGHNLQGVGKSAYARGVQLQQQKSISAVSALARSAQDVALAVNQSTQLIKDAMGGHVLIRQAPDETNEILIMDNPDPALATKVWRWNMGGLGYSDNCTGADNPARQYEIAMTMDGAINANFVLTGLLSAAVVQIGQATTFEEGYDPTDIAADLDTFITTTYPEDLAKIQDQLDGKIETYFQETDPNTWDEADRAKHNGDMWFNTTVGSKELKRYNGTLNSWELIEDQKAIDAYTNASTAQDTADRKRTVFTTQPDPPYDVGDLWTEGSEGDLKRCKTAKDSEGVYSASDWELATKYTDDSVASSKNTTFSTCPSNGKYKKDDIMIPSESFVSGAKTFYAGEIYQALADGGGVAFNSAHWTEASLISLWKKTGTTTIDGGQIAADSVEALSLKGDTAMVNFLNALNITAKYISATGITAGTLTLTANLNIESSDGNLEINGTQLKYTHADGTESRLGASGLRLYENGLLLPYISTVDAGMIDKFNETEGYWNYIVGNGYKKYFYLKRRGIRWLNQADNVKMLVTQGEELEWYDPSQYRHTGIKGMKYAVGDITNIAAGVTVRLNTVPSGSTASMILLDFDANNRDGYYAQEYITIGGETRKIVQYDGGTRRAYVDNSFSSAPESGDVYLIHTGPGGVNIEVESWYLAPWYSGSSGGEYYYPLTFGFMLILNN